MKSERHYYIDAYLNQFEAKVVEAVEDNGRLALILDKTSFYPTSGGQPHDLGTINQISVVNVEIREEDGAILHWIDGNVPAQSKVKGQINWVRRFDHMQQHTGQHILSQAFIQLADANTVGFHLSDNSVTIDLDIKNIGQNQLNEVEQLANEKVWENLPIQVRMVSKEEALTLPLRKIPAAQSGQLRLVEIGSFDLTACGGTHVSATGAVGMIKLLKAEKRRGQMRIEFCCGQRALHNVQQKHTIVSQLTADLTTGVSDLPSIISKLQAKSKQQRRQIKKQQATLLKYEAKTLLNDNKSEQGVMIIAHLLEDGDAANMRTLAQHLTNHPQTITLLGVTNDKTNLLFTRSDDAPGDMNSLLQEAFKAVGGGSGGGRSNQAQGGGPAVSATQLRQILASVKLSLIAQLSIVNK